MDAHIRPLPGHPVTIPAQLRVRSTQELLGRHLVATATASAAPIMLNHPPILLVHEEGGEDLLNPDAVMDQLNIDKVTLHNDVPTNLVAWVIDISAVEAITTRVLRFLFGPIQLLSYRKITNEIVEQLANDFELEREIKKDIFRTNKMNPRHFKVLFYSANLGERSINNLAQKYRIAKNAGKNNTTPSLEKKTQKKVKNHSRSKKHEQKTHTNNPVLAPKITEKSLQKESHDMTITLDEKNYSGVEKAEIQFELDMKESD